MEIFHRMRKIRESMGLSQGKFSENLGLSQSTYANYEKGTRAIPDKVKVGVAHFGVDMNWLLTGEGNMFRDTTPSATRLSDHDRFEKTFPDVYSLYRDYEELKSRQGSGGCRLCPKVNRLDRERSTKLEGYADALLTEQRQESDSQGLPVEEVREPRPRYEPEGETPNTPTPILGRTAAGPPLDTERWPDTWMLVRLQSREDPRSHYLLEVAGTSMVDAGIPDNSLILVRRAEEARGGQIVIAHTPQEGVTLKRLTREDGQLVLQWQDGSGRTLKLTEQTRIQGVFIRVIERPKGQ